MWQIPHTNQGYIHMQQRRQNSGCRLKRQRGRSVCVGVFALHSQISFSRKTLLCSIDQPLQKMPAFKEAVPK